MLLKDLQKAIQERRNDNLDVPEVRLSTKPKYDPCREFRTGDKVRMVMRDGRHPYCTRMREHIVPSDTIATVVKCELNGFVAVEYNNGYKPVVHFSFLELVTPMEAAPYFISEGAGIIELYKRTPDEVVKTWFYDAVKAGVEALAEAEAECARLNAEYKKDPNNYCIAEIYDIDDGKLIGYEVARGDTRDSIFYGGENHLRTIEQAKEAAEDERDRLNDKWRKEKNNV